MAKFCPSKKIEDQLLIFIINVVSNQTPFDAKLKSLQLLRRIMERDLKLSSLPVNIISEQLVKENVVDYLLKYFNPEIFKRYIPILSITSDNVKKALSQKHVDELFKLM